ncbi:MAG TPA: cellulase family glycosylhydrolase [Polyangiaceae bacterium]|jgi:hypothetical protein
MTPKGSSSSSGGSGSSSSGAKSSSSSSSSGAGSSSSSSGGATAAKGYTVSGPSVLDASGAKHIFRGVARPSFEWSAIGENFSQTDYDTMKSWGANVVRFSLNQDFWIIDPSNANAVGAYPDNVDAQVQGAEADGLDVILDLHWSDAGSFSNMPGQWCMADQNSITFWTQLATKYKSDPHVLFELYNEPHDVAWNVWLNGGSASCNTSNGNVTYQVAGMQQLYNAVRATGAQNIVIAGGLQFAFDLSGVPSNRIVGTNIMYNTHPYNEFQKTTQAEWYNAFGFLAATDPIMATEFGDTSSSTCSSSTYDASLLPYFDAMGTAGTNPANRISWTAWAFYPGGCGFPSLLTDWSYDLTAPGATVVASLKAFHQ